MTARDLYETALIEQNKLEAPSLLLEDYNYFINKAIQQYINLVYNKQEMDQQSTDDLRVLKTSVILNPVKLDTGNTNIGATTSLFASYYSVNLPNDYMHLLNCIIEYKLAKSFKCYETNNIVQFAARRLTSDMYTQILNNAYLKPTYKRPYYYLSNINDPQTGSTVGSTTTLPTNKTNDDIIEGMQETDKASPSKKDGILSQEIENTRSANTSTVRMELRFGKDASIFIPIHCYIDYIKAPMYIRLTQDQIDSTIDTSQVLEFPDYVCYEIVNIFTRLLMENASDPRLQTNMPINNTIISQQQVAAIQQQQSK